MNKVILIGHVGKDPIVKSAANTKVAQFSLATTERYKPEGGEVKEITDWHSIVVWGKLAELCEKYVAKGQRISIEGKLKQRSYEGKDGAKRFVVEVVAESVEFLSKIEKQDTAATAEQPAASPEELNDLPF